MQLGRFSAHVTVNLLSFKFLAWPRPTTHWDPAKQFTESIIRPRVKGIARVVRLPWSRIKDRLIDRQTDATGEPWNGLEAECICRVCPCLSFMDLQEQFLMATWYKANCPGDRRWWLLLCVPLKLRRVDKKKQSDTDKKYRARSLLPKNNDQLKIIFWNICCFSHR